MKWTGSWIDIPCTILIYGIFACVGIMVLLGFVSFIFNVVIG